MIALLLTQVLLATASDCTPGPAADPPRPGEARAYLAAAEEELAAGQQASARAALRRALELDPADAAAARRLAALCQPALTFEHALEQLDAQGCGVAAPLFEELGRRGPDASVALLEGICRYELAQDARAVVLLERAAADPELRDSASLFLGLIALRSDRREDAGVHLAAAGASADPRLRSAAADLRRASVRDGRLLVSLSAEGGYDTNAGLVADTAQASSRLPDAGALLTASARLQLWPSGGPYLRASGATRRQRTLSGLDFGLAGAFAGVRLGGGRSSFDLEAGAERMWLGGALYQDAAALTAAARLGLGPSELFAAASYSGRRQAFTAPWAAYSGTSHRGVAEVGLDLDGTVLSLGATAQRDLAAAPAHAFLEVGPRAQLLVRLGPQARLLATAALRRRAHDASDPTFGVVRTDLTWSGELLCEYDLLDTATLYLLGGARQVSSSVAAFGYSQLSASAGLVVYWAGP